MERQRQLGDPDPADQDRYVLLEGLLSARQHLLITWNSRDPRSGDLLMPCTPVRQWLALLEQDLGDGALELVLRQPAANPLERRNFLPEGERAPICSDRRLLEARRMLENQGSSAPRPLVDPAGPAEPPLQPLAPLLATAPIDTTAATSAYADLLAWLQAPQRCWLAGLGLRPQESSQPIEDLEPFSLEERQRAQLLRNALEAGECPDLPRELRGRGLLPPKAAGVLEAQRLSQRWCSLDQLLAGLGEERRQLAQGAGTGGRAALARRCPAAGACRQTPHPPAPAAVAGTAAGLRRRPAAAFSPAGGPPRPGFCHSREPTAPGALRRGPPAGSIATVAPPLPRALLASAPGDRLGLGLCRSQAAWQGPAGGLPGLGGGIWRHRRTPGRRDGALLWPLLAGPRAGG